ncbi:MAG: MFS transporter [Alistipes sp.]|nr:MFS transporter [Alistipes sp.]
MAAARLEKIGYGLGDMSSSMFWKIFTYYLPFFYSNIFGLSLEHAALLLLVTKLWDAVSDPVMGIIADRTRSRWGRYRPYLLWVAGPFAVAGVLTFTTPDWSDGAKLVWAYATYILMMTVYTAINVPYGAMLGVVTDDSAERTVFSSYRMFFAYGGSFLALALFEPLCGFFTGDVATMTPAEATAAQAAGWQRTMMVIGLLCAVLFYCCFRWTRERIAAVGNDKESILRDIRALAGNGPWWLLLGVAIAVLLFNSIRGGAAAYFFKDFVGPNNLLGGSMLLTCGVFLAVGEIANMAGVALAVPVSRRIGKRMTYIAAMAVAGVLSGAFYFVPATNAGAWAMLVLQIVISAAAGITFPLLWSMFADVADYSELRHGHGSTGLIFSSSSMAQKFGGAFGSALILWLLAAYGYDTSASAAQSGQAIVGLRMLMSWIPAAGCAAAIVLVALYPLGEKRVRAIAEQLALRRASKA